MLVLDIVFSYMRNVSWFFAFFAVLSFLLAAGFFIAATNETSKSDTEKRYLNAARKWVWLAALGVILGAWPKPETLWETRIVMLKLGLASAENVQAGIGTVERIGKKIECKYLGGEGCEPKK